MNVFAVVKENVTARQVAMQYGIKINRSGLACCPFHKDKTPSMKIDKRYYCFGCGDTGDAIDFVAKYFGLAPKEAAMKIASDFGLNYDATNRAPPKKMAPKKTPEQILDEEQKQCFCVLSDYYHLLRKWKTEYAPKSMDEEWHPCFVEALQNISKVEYQLDTLLEKDIPDRASVVSDIGKGVKSIAGRIEEYRRSQGDAGEHRKGRSQENRRIEDVIKVVANENRYHPVLDRINSITWDGWERIRYALHHFLGAEVSEYTYEVMKLFMIGTIARISCPGIKFEVMLCLVGGQGAGKSTFLRFLAMEDDWFTDDLKKMDDDNVYRKIQGHLIIEFPEMVAILNAKNVEDTKSFMSRQKDTYKTPYDRHPKDHKRQCVFAGSSNSLDFLPMDRSGNRRFLPILCNMEEAETHILDDEKTSREYIDQMWAEAMEIYRSGKCQLRLPKEMEKELCEYQKQFMQEDTKKELILDYLEHYEGSMVCSRQLYSEALGNDGNPAQWEIREINDIMNNCSNWIAFSNPRHFPEPYRRQKGWEKPDNRGQDFQPITKEQMEQLSLPPEWMER